VILHPPLVSPRPRAFAALSVRDYRIYWWTGLISNIGTAMQGAEDRRHVLTHRAET